MTEPNGANAPNTAENTSGFFINAGTHTGWFTTPDGDIYDIRKLEPREVTDPRNGEVTTIWGGYATARDRDLAAKDAMLQAEFKKTGARPAELFAPEATRHPALHHAAQPPRQRLQPTSARSGTPRAATPSSPAISKANVVCASAATCCAWKSAADLDAERAAKTDSSSTCIRCVAAPDAAAARDGATKRARKGRDATPSADA